MPIVGGPYLAAAFFCDRVLREHDGVLSFIRVVDKWTVQGPTEAMPPTVIQTNLVVLMKSGIHRGGSQVTIVPTSPSGKLLQSVSLPILFEGDDDHGSAVIAAFGFPVQESGLYWFDIRIDDQSFTMVPLRVVYLRSIAMPMAALPPNS